MNTSEVIDNILAHHGVKGMRWGVRKAVDTAIGTKTAGRRPSSYKSNNKTTQQRVTGSSAFKRFSKLSDANVQRHNARQSAKTARRKAAGKGATRTTKTIAGLGKATRRVGSAIDTARFEVAAKDSATVHKIASKASERLVKDLPRIKARHGEGAKLGNRMKHPLSPEARAYRADVQKAYLRHLESSANSMTNRAGTVRYTLKENGKPNTSKYWWDVSTEVVKHAADGTFRVQPIFDDDGWIIDLRFIEDDLAQSAIDDILAHHGVKGMRWGVRRKATVGPQEIIVSDRRRSVRTSGGAGHPATESATRARVIGQKAKKSGLKSLSDQELNDYAKRIQMEQNVSRLMYNEKSRGAQFADKLLGRKGSQLADKVAQEGAARAGRSALNVATRKSIKVARIAAFA